MTTCAYKTREMSSLESNTETVNFHLNNWHAIMLIYHPRILYIKFLCNYIEKLRLFCYFRIDIAIKKIRSRCHRSVNHGMLHILKFIYLLYYIKFEFSTIHIFFNTLHWFDGRSDDESALYIKKFLNIFRYIVY